MSFTTALENLHEDLILVGQTEDRRNQLAKKLCEALNECLKVFPDRDLSRRTIHLYPCEVLAAQHFLTQMGCHLQSLGSDTNIDGTLTYGIFPNWN